MNIIHQNDQIKSMAEAGLLTRKEVQAAIEGPVFEFQKWNSLGEDEIQYLQSIGVLRDEGPHANACVRWGPFLCWRIVGSGGFMQVWRNVKEHSWRMVRHMNIGESAREMGQPVGGEYTTWFDMNSGPDYKVIWRYRLYVNGRQSTLMDDAPAKERGVMEDVIVQTWGILGAFVSHIALPGTTVLRVGPPLKPGKSAQWQMARTHHLLLTQRQAQTMQRKLRPATDRDVVMAAHWRRAHFRRLSSDKFIHKRGLVVPVRQAWVGPKEWIGSDRKIYRVIDVTPPVNKSTS